MARIAGIGGHTRRPLVDGWELASVPPGAAADPAALAALAPAWMPAQVPGTAASSLRAAGAWSLEKGAPRSFDAVDWWYRCRFAAAGEGARALRMDGLATVADVWLNGEHLLRSDNMFHAHDLDVGEHLRGDNELLIRFTSLAKVLEARRPRPRWKTKLVAHQQLRWLRTTLLGRMPGWTPPAAPVGPWRPIVFEERAGFAVARADVRARIEGRHGILDADLLLAPLGPAPIDGATLALGDARAPLDLHHNDDGRVSLRGAARLPDVARWWPHTHGAQPRYPAAVVVRIGGDEAVIDLGLVGFRTLELATAGDDFAFTVNGAPIFCRGACWTTADIVTLAGEPAAVRASLEAARRAGMNMLRIGGTMAYETDLFYEICDELGILVWQEYAFANMDYPAADAAFVASVRREAEHLLDRVQLRPCLALLCGNSEVEQQAAMLGLPRESWSSPLFSEVLPEVGRALRPDVAYWPSSPSGGTLPFQIDAGVAHYYGVGAYLRPLEDARRAEVRFASECLAFANVPDAATIERVLGAGEAPVHHPAWKARVPRDVGSGWDFEDVRDHYLEALFGVDPVKLRWSDAERYLALGRVVTGEVMARTLAEWRRRRSTCRGALIWTYQDLWPGAGWGIVDSTGRPKAAYRYVARAMQPLLLTISDEGLSGLRVHAVNDGAAPIDAELRVRLYRRGHVVVATGATPITLPARGQVEVHADALFEGFLDTSYAYRFGPPGHDLVVATLLRGGARIADAFHFPVGLPAGREEDLDLQATVAPAAPDGTHALSLRARRFALAVAVDADGFRPDDDYLHLEPGEERTLTLTPTGAPGRAPAGSVHALNAWAPVKLLPR